MEDRFRIGVITATHGIKGEVKVFPTTDDVKRYDVLEKCFFIYSTGILKCIKYFYSVCPAMQRFS